MDNIIKFLRNEDTDYKGRKLQDLWVLDADKMEHSHDVIQWMFPSDIPSQHHYASPVLTEEQVNTMWRDEKIRKSIETSCDVFAKFLMETKPDWITLKNHNYLRITRVLRCLWNMRMGDEWIKWRSLCANIYENYPNEVGEETFSYWMNAHNL